VQGFLYSLLPPEDQRGVGTSQAEDAYAQASEPKELYIVPGARHIDLYDRTDMIPFDKLTDFFTKALG